ncbi:hypothetical protein SAMN04487830_10174 [Pseudobutyrivibrio sp. OR37]|uniref:hypothetical protein n=1 Tax=Pseudobutyrivibrio sp. OR37 TaxID=1798186 RepID=UPI0008F41B5E|nr:hypothetical protein [Pseudobutyrivibrio sp. OR37]SFH52863.1 hypothetical protein SAMN04487830_10174 [Pseudobutyrivibrio sp. OR37]
MKKMTGALLIMLTIILTMLTGTVSYAAATSTIVFEGLEVGDVVEIYRICNYDDSGSSYTWASAVTTWMTDNRTGKFYADLSPSGLQKMKAKDSKEFCELLLDGLKNTSTGVANLQGQSFEYQVGVGNTVEIEPGIYIVLPKGKSRVYDIEWFVLGPGKEKSIVYTEDKYSLPSVESTIKNTTKDRGFVNETVPMTEYDDQVTVDSVLKMPSYNDMYSDGKRVLTISYVIPNGMDYVEDSANLLSVTEEGEEALLESAYTVMTYSNVSMYKDYNDNFIFFGAQDYYYELDGNHLVGPDGTKELALEAYNSAYQTEYEIEETHLQKIGKGLGTSTAEEISPEDSEEASEEVVEEPAEGEDSEIISTDEIGGTTEDKSKLIYKTRGVSVVVVSLDTAVDISTLKTSISAKKNQYSTADGWYDIYTSLSYSVSPLDRNLRANIKTSSRAAAYGIRITSCMGYADSYQKSSEEILATAPRMVDDKFTLYKKSNTYSGDIDEAVAQVAAENKDIVQLIYDKELNVTYEYKEYASLNVNDEGQIAIGGIITGEYLIVQTEHVPGYALSELSFLIEANDWQDEKYMEGNCVFDLVWLDYKTVYLPATGEDGLETDRALGILVTLFAALGIAQVYRKYHKFSIFKV